MNELGLKIREVRKRKKVTLVELAKATGVAQASLSRIETGVMIGTVESHRKIAESLGISLAELYEGLDDRKSDITHSEPQEENITIVGDNIKQEVLTTNANAKKIIPTLLTLGANSETKIDKLERGVERFYWVCDGEITVLINSTEYILKKKHSIYFDASLPHKLKNASPMSAQVFCATSPAKI